MKLQLLAGGGWWRWPGRAGAGGERRASRPASAPVPGDKPLAVTIWYPTDAPERPTPLALYSQSVAPGAAGRGPRPSAGRDLARHRRVQRRPLRHRPRAGRGGLRRRRADPHRRHPGRPQPLDADHRAPGAAVPGDRLHDPRLARPRRGRRRQVGAFGFSSGGFTVLGAIGGEPDMSAAGAPLRRASALLRLRAAAASSAPRRRRRPAPVAHDPRIKAAVVAAPALGFAFAPAGPRRR